MCRRVGGNGAREETNAADQGGRRPTSSQPRVINRVGTRARRSPTTPHRSRRVQARHRLPQPCATTAVTPPRDGRAGGSKFRRRVEAAAAPTTAAAAASRHARRHAKSSGRSRWRVHYRLRSAANARAGAAGVAPRASTDRGRAVETGRGGAAAAATLG